MRKLSSPWAKVLSVYMEEPEAEIITALLDGPAHRFADPIAAEVPTSGVGICDCAPPRLNAGLGPSLGQQAGY